MDLSNKHLKTLESIFKSPVSSSIEWDDIEALLRALGGQISEGRGSRVRIKLNNTKAVFHRPHPEKETDKGAVKSVRKFLEEAGVEL